MKHTSFKVRRSKTKNLFLILLAVLLLISFFAYIKYKNDTHLPLDKNNSENISIIIKKGQSIREIGEQLKSKEIIRSKFAFYWYTRLNKLDKNIVVGRFVLTPSMTIEEILSKITDSKESEAVITIQEGLKIKDIDRKLSDLELANEGDFINAVKNFNDYEFYTFLDKEVLKNLDLPLEGYIYPDTYFLDPTNFTANDLIYKTLNNFKRKIESYPEILTQSKIKLHNLITMASIIEKEVISDSDRKVVAGILWKRLNSGWKLDADATLLYTKNDNKITSSDLNSDSAYNTRKLLGLPPGPICNPSINSILASLNSTDSEYWFYLTAKNGETKYAKSNEEHNSNKAKYL